MEGLFDSAWLKWGWAVRESETLKQELRAFTGHPRFQDLLAMRCHYYSKRHGFALTVERIVGTPPWLVLRLSTVAHHYRSSLDNLAWALVCRGDKPPRTLTPAEQSAIAFPITSSRRSFNRCLKSTEKRPAKLPGVRGRDIALIRAAQPYRHGKRNRPFHTIKVLANFNNADKHRFIQPILWLPHRLNYEVIDYGDCVLTSTPTPRSPILKVGAEVAFFRARKTGPNPYLQVEYELVALPAVHNALSIEDWLDKTQMLVESILDRVSEPPHREFLVLGLRKQPVVKS